MPPAPGSRPIVVQGIQPGGQLTTTTDVENYPGFRDVIQGPWLMEEMQAQAEHVGTKMVWDHITEVDLSRRPFRLTGDSGTDYSADALVIATGAQAKWLGLPSEEHMKGKGASACATCDGFFYRGKKVAVIGGGNTAVEEALYLTNHSHDVTLIHRRDACAPRKSCRTGCSPTRTSRSSGTAKSPSSSAAAMPEALVGLDMRNTQTGEISRIDVDGAFVAIGHKPATELFEGKLKLDSDGYIEVETGSTRTSVAGVFACGDVMDKIYRQAVTAAGTGCMAALDAEKYLAAEEYEAIGRGVELAQPPGARQAQAAARTFRNPRLRRRRPRSGLPNRSSIPVSKVRHGQRIQFRKRPEQRRIAGESGNPRGLQPEHVGQQTPRVGRPGLRARIGEADARGAPSRPRVGRQAHPLAVPPPGR